MTKPSDGYFFAKREIVKAIDGRISKLHTQMEELDKTSENVDLHRSLKSQIRALENIRNFVRNVMLWDTSKGN